MRAEALRLAESPVEDPASLVRASRTVSRRAESGEPAYRRALRQAEAACRLAPYRPSFQVTRGMALYRLGKYAEAR